jgi:dGTPase
MDDEQTYRTIAAELGIEERDGKFARHPLVYLVEAADDICYEIMDIEDAHKLRLLTTEETKSLLLGFFNEERQQHVSEICNEVDDINEQIVYLRSGVIGTLIDECIETFIANEEKILDGTFEGSLIKNIQPRVRDAYRRCVDISVKRIYSSKDVVDIELAGYRIISTLIDLFTTATMHPDRAYSKLLLNRVSSQYEVRADNVYTRIMAVLDFISGMTDVFALDLYRKINGESIPTIQ